jgi:hypothetical protein
VAITVRSWTSLVAPVPMPLKVTVVGPLSSATVRAAKASKVGASFTGFTVSSKLWVELNPSPSVTVTAMVA